mmetsp:Transcript_39754/g.96012  ORF Transcript_39754/g.96012 Transcript_39754/m.96012 type:complete len:330 (+) Transcript_39754:101-1090(+)
MEDSSINERVPLAPQQDFPPSDDQEAPSMSMRMTTTHGNDDSPADIRVSADSQENEGIAEAGLFVATSITTSLDMDEWKRKIHKLQLTSLVVAHVLAIVLVVLVAQWVHQLGGLSWKAGQAKLIFNWHPLLMILAFCFMTVSSLSFRYHQFGLLQQHRRSTAKLLHGIGWFIAVACMSMGVVAAFFSHNDRASGFIANLYSLHSWVGITVLLLYLVQFLVGVGAFALPLGGINSISAVTKAKILQVHTFFGPILYLSIMLTILLGIQEKEGFIGCGYKVDAPDMVPFQHFSKIPAICKQSHAMGFCILLMGLCTMFALHQMDRTKYRQH